MTLEPLLEAELPRDPQAAALARDLIKGLRKAIVGISIDDLCLLTTELVTNCIEHTSTDRVWLRVAVSMECVRVVVEDEGGSTAPVLHAPTSFGEDGRGLSLVDGVAHRWGTSLDGHVAVWFEIDTRADAGLGEARIRRSND
jgi:anti-sigma regulatory factor (Ser/Thr protein kinase)